MTATIPALALAVGCWVLVAVKVRDLIVDRARSLVLREYTICVVAMAAVFTLLVPPVYTSIDRISANLAMLPNSLFGIVCLAAAQTTLIAGSTLRTTPSGQLATADRRTCARRLRRWWTAAVATDAAKIALFVSAPPSVHHVETFDFSTTYIRYPSLAADDALRLVWFWIAFFNVWRTYRGYARAEPARSTRWGLRLHSAVGSLGLIYVGYETAYLILGWAGRPLPGSERTIGTLCLAVIVAVLIAATAMLHLGPELEARRTYRALAPLWQATAAHQPGAILDHHRFTPTQRVIRRRQETSDGLARLSGHYNPRRWELAYQQATALGAPNAAALADAITILAAVRSEHDGHPPDQATHHILSAPTHDNVDWQITISTALRDRPWEHRALSTLT